MPISSYDITEPAHSTIFLNDVSVVDHAYIDDKGCIVGGSFNPCFEISGVPDGTEKVVVDFSTIKHDIKELIDRHTFDLNKNGFDHKVWIIKGYSHVSTFLTFGAGTNAAVSISTPVLALDLPVDAVKVIPAVEGMVPSYDFAYIAAAFEQYIQPHLRELYPNVNIRVKCYNTTNIHVPNDNLRSHAKPFRYVHGLKDSTSYGCNNIAHGHGSFITADHNPQNILQDVADDLDNTIFVRRDNLSTLALTSDSVTEITIRYHTPRGFFMMTVSPADHKIVVLNTETTVEYLTQYVKTKYGQQMKDLGVSYFCISEGLSKGAVETL